jgi:hypothetical protein
LCNLRAITLRLNYAYIYKEGSRDSSVGIVTGYGLDERGVDVRVPVGSRIFSPPRRPDRLWSPPIQWVTGAVCPEVKQPGREADHSPPTSAEVKKMRIYTSTPPCAFMAYWLISYAQEQLYPLYLLGIRMGMVLKVLKTFFFICAVGLWVLRPLLAYCTSPG